MKRPNPLPPDMLSPAERRAELCRLLAAGLVRLRMRENGQLSAKKGEFPLHNSLDQSGSAGPTERRTA
ncbi:hypothetical protein SAMN05444006_106163 [Allgaiera indica]|uniref:TubC N-terminal docking domain-containing protein n=1 Tax=Allgaiera indica TaxID=765699 RepID=A0A1H2W4K5_9RHOB|nr:hypothetical protein SAMN05444006_106163 [Allgaiera indica]